jgi:hypothetical protein
MYKLVDPLEVFNRIVGVTSAANPSGEASGEAQKRRARNQSVLDAVLENAQRTRSRLGANDQHRMDEFLESVRSVERRVTGASTGLGASCGAVAPSVIVSAEQSAVAPRQTTENYDKGLHADAMNDLIAMAFECDVTRVISYMLEDERSEFTYDHVEERSFTAEASTAKGGPCPEYHAAQHMGGDPFSTITWWNVGKVAELCGKLDAIEEAPGVSVLDNTVVLFAGCMQGGTHLANNLPVALVGGSALGLKTDQHVVLENRPLRDLYFTLMNQAFSLDIGDFGQNLTNAPVSTLEALF